MRKFQLPKVLLVRKASNMAKHSVVKEEADRETLLESLIEKLGIKKNLTGRGFYNRSISKD